MSLPKIEYPIFSVVIPSTNKKVKLRPFLVKEEKLLLFAQTSGTSSDIIESIKQVINNCLMDKVDVDELTTFDIEYLFLKLRARSVNNLVDIYYKDSDDGESYKVTVNLDDVEIMKNPEHKTKVEINKDLGLFLRYPRADMVDKIGGVDSEVDMYFEVIKYCIEKVYDNDTVYDVSDYSNEELSEFVSTLDVTTFKKIQHFLETMPRIHYETRYYNRQGVEKKITLQTLNDFFMLG